VKRSFHLRCLCAGKYYSEPVCSAVVPHCIRCIARHMVFCNTSRFLVISPMERSQASCPFPMETPKSAKGDGIRGVMLQ
jgi:hypothetical protein